MDFIYSEEQLAIKEMAASFARDELAPHAAKWDEQSYFPIDVLKQAASLGLAGIYTKSDIGGSELSRLDAAIIFEELSTACVSTSAFLSIHNMVTAIIDNYANPELRAQFGPKLTQMELVASYCLTEPNSGSDAASLKTFAQKEGDHYVLNGAKAFISGGGVSDVYAVMVRTGDESYRGISCLLVEKDTPGLSFGAQEKKLGWKSQPTSMVFFENCKVPVSNLIGQEGQGFKIALNALNGGRINIGACSLGGAKACLRHTRSYMAERKQFGKSLEQFQALRFKYADMITRYESAKLMVHRAADALDKNLPNTPMYCAMAKRQATDMGFSVCNDAMQLHGGYGYLCDYPIERIFRDLRVHQILEGTNEIMREIIAKNAFSEEFIID
jgi:butyryl-CoA dehydrogenase